MSTPPTTPTRKQRRQQQLKLDFEATLTPSDTISDHDSDCLTIRLTLPSSMAQPMRLLVCSIGNRGPYINTLHSAGHTVLDTLASSLGYPGFQKSAKHGNGLISAGGEFTLWQSSSQMNVSGVGVSRAWKSFVAESRGQETKLVIVHDELELALGQVKVKAGTASPKGHNGLKSINECLKGEAYTRIGVGIGRPLSRDREDVSAFVLRKMTGAEKRSVEGTVGAVEMELRRLAQG
ncbi:hypothetical protein LZ554_006373 [Drepanopeziza brunnea f. sp. 'monogermtubi']|nr:hypothetical protein LZ554_006373 [Drepanopeziza brunnea f. sp. 'monogermtubi']